MIAKKNKMNEAYRLHYIWSLVSQNSSLIVTKKTEGAVIVGKTRILCSTFWFSTRRRENDLMDLMGSGVRESKREKQLLRKWNNETVECARLYCTILPPISHMPTIEAPYNQPADEKIMGSFDSSYNRQVLPV